MTMTVTVSLTVASIRHNGCVHDSDRDGHCVHDSSCDSGCVRDSDRDSTQHTASVGDTLFTVVDTNFSICDAS